MLASMSRRDVAWRGTTYNAGAGGLTRLPELARGVSLLGLLVGLAENGGKDGGLDSLGEDKSQGDSRGLDGGKVWCGQICQR